MKKSLLGMAKIRVLVRIVTVSGQPVSCVGIWLVKSVPKFIKQEKFTMDKLNGTAERRVDEHLHSRPNHEVSVTVDGVEKRVPRGTYIVSVFKQLVGVDASHELDEVVDGEFKPLDDNASITIEHHEKFVSHVRTGSSS